MTVSGELMSGWLVGCGFDLSGQGADLDEVAGEGAVPALRTPLVQVAVDGCEAIAAAGDDCPWCAPGSADDPFNCRCQLRCIMRISELDVMVEDDAVGVVSNLGR